MLKVQTVFSGQATKASRFTLVIDGDCGERELRNTITLLIAHAEVMRDDGTNGAAEYDSWFAEAKAGKGLLSDHECLPTA